MVVSKTIISRISEEVENIMLKKVENKESKKIILLTNDDGIEAPGIKALFNTFIKDKKYDVRVVAPDRERSAVGHAITVFDPIAVKKEYIDGIFCGYSVDGTPADCVKLAIAAILERKPDILISGINRGANIGENIIYSGTVSAATEGTIYDIPSIAVSIDSFKDTDCSFAAAFTKKIAELVLETKNLLPRTLLNINYPDIPAEKIKGVKFTYQSSVKFRDIFIKRVDPRGRDYYWMDGEYEVLSDDEDSDYVAIKNNYISITPIQHDMTDYKRMDYYKNLLDKELKSKNNIK
jgi:5''/3''-nucleotidase SurE